MSTLAIVTANQFRAVRAMAWNADTRALAETGGILTHAMEQDLGDEHLDWLRTRLGLDVEMTDRGLVCSVKVAS